VNVVIIVEERSGSRIAETPSKIIWVDPRTDTTWSHLVNRLSGSVFHSPDWIRVLADTYGWNPSALVVIGDSGEPVAGIPFIHVSDVLGDRAVALPFSDYCDPLVTDKTTWRLLSDRLLEKGCRINLRCLRNALPLEDERFSTVRQAKWHALDLRPDTESLWREIDDSAQRAIRKSLREGIRVRVAQCEKELRTFFEMHLKVRKYKYGLFAQPYTFFQNIWRHFVKKGHGFLLLAVKEDKILAGDFFLEWNGTLYYKFNASFAEDLLLRPNDLLIWEAIQRGKSRGFATLDFGLSDWDQEGLVRYKRKFGVEEGTISFLHHEPDGAPPMNNEVREILSKVTRTFTDHRVPDSMTELAGGFLYKHFV